MAGTKTKSASKKTSSRKTTAAKKTAPAKSQAVAEGAEADGTLKGAPVVAPARTPSTLPQGDRPADEKLDKEQHVHTERADAMLPGAPPSVVVTGVDELRLQDALSKQTKK